MTQRPQDSELRRLAIARQAAMRGSSTYFTRAAFTIRDQVDVGNRSIGAVIATENPVVIFDRRTERVMQEILVASGAQLYDWVPMLENHYAWDLRTLGSVLDSQVSGNQIIGRLSFAATPDVDPIWIRVRDGHLRAVSIGGRRVAFTDIEPGQTATIGNRRFVAGRLPLRVTTKWIQREASVVVFGADGGAGTQV